MNGDQVLMERRQRNCGLRGGCWHLGFYR
jgi:hypothetical protein